MEKDKQRREWGEREEEAGERKAGAEGRHGWREVEGGEDTADDMQMSFEIHDNNTSW